MESNEVLKILKLDHILIDEAFRRLSVGTCCLEGEQRDLIHELFEKTSQAIKDHVAIEEDEFLPRVPPEDAILMRNEHTKLLDLLAEARFAISHQRALTFTVLVEALRTALDRHDIIERRLFASIGSEVFTHNSIMSIQARISENIV